MDKQGNKTVWQKLVSSFPILPAIAVLAIVVGALSGYQPNEYAVRAQAQTAAVSAQASGSVADLADGTYTGSAEGFNGPVTVAVTVKDKKITDVVVKGHTDTPSFFNRAKAGVVPAILKKQSADVDVVSGATYSSNGIKNAVRNALGQPTSGSLKRAAAAPAAKQAAVVAPPAGSTYVDGVYRGKGEGFKGTTTVDVTIKDGKIADIKVVSYKDDAPFFNRAKSLTNKIVKEQSANVDAVSGATYSSNGIKAAVADALNQAVAGVGTLPKAAADEAETVPVVAELVTDETGKKTQIVCHPVETASAVLKDGEYVVTSKVVPTGIMKQFEEYPITMKVTNCSKLKIQLQCR